MEYDILNEILTTTVGTLFKGVAPAVEQEIRMSMTSLPPSNSMDWVRVEGKARLENSFRKLNLDHNSSGGQYLSTFTLEQLLTKKRKVKNELKIYDSNFKSLFSRQPRREEKEPMRPLYMFYKKLKQTISKRPPEREQFINSAELEGKLGELRAERAELRKLLHNFQVEFSRTNNRKIRYHSDVTPVENEYNRYKQVKADIANYEASLKSAS